MPAFRDKQIRYVSELEMVLNMEKLELMLQKQQEFIAILIEKLSMNVNIKTEPLKPHEPKPSSESLIQQISEFFV